MPFEAILNEVDQLHNVSTHLEGLADQHPPVSEALMMIAETFATLQPYWQSWWRLSAPKRSEIRKISNCGTFG
jgi:hypothetical protein